MLPIKPDTGAKEIVIAKDQPEYHPLPAAVYENEQYGSPELLTRWTLSDEERQAVLAGEDIYISVLTFGKPYPPMTVQVGPQYFQLAGDITDKISPNDKKELADFKDAVSTGTCPYCRQTIKPSGRKHDIPANPYERDGEWYFADETEQEHGPFLTKQEADQQLAAYCAWLEGKDQS